MNHFHLIYNILMGPWVPSISKEHIFIAIIRLFGTLFFANLKGHSDKIKHKIEPNA